MSEGKSLPSPSAAEPRPGMAGTVPANGVSVADGAKSTQVDPAKAAPPGGHGFLRGRRLIVGTIGVFALAVVLWFGIPWIRFALSTVSTDDAFVNGHATFVAPRVHGQVSSVLVPFVDAVAVKKAVPRVRISMRPRPWHGASKHRPGAGAGTCNTP
jgi:hypothetical protein